MQAPLRIPFPGPLLVKGGFKLPEGQTMMRLFAYWLASGHWRMQTGVLGIGEEGTAATAAVIPLAVVVGSEQWKAERRGMACHAHPCAWGLTSLTSRGRMRTPTPTPAAQSGKPPPPPASRHRSPQRQGPPIQAPPQTRRHVGGRGGGGVAAWPQQQQQQSQLWQVRVISSEAAVRALEQRLAKANDAMRAAEVERDTLRRDKERLTAKSGGGENAVRIFPHFPHFFRIFRAGPLV